MAETIMREIVKRSFSFESNFWVPALFQHTDLFSVTCYSGILSVFSNSKLASKCVLLILCD